MKHLIGRFWLPGVLSCLYGLGFLLQENQSHDPASDKRAMIEASLEPSQSKAWQSIAGAAESVKAVPALPVPPEFGVTDLAVLAESASTQEKKRRFFALLQPLIRQENHYILQQRAWLKQLDVQNLVEQERTLLRQLATEYKVKAEDDRARYQELMVRVDSIPLELVLAQAANESAWGSSRFAREGNNLFGQWCFTPGCGLVPARRSDGEHHEVAKFVSAQQSVRAYLHNLNTFKAYRELRQLRAQLRHKQEAVSGMVLVEGLQRYSQRGMDYVRDLQSMMRVNQPLVAQVARQVLSSY